MMLARPALTLALTLATAMLGRASVRPTASTLTAEQTASPIPPPALGATADTVRLPATASAPPSATTPTANARAAPPTSVASLIANLPFTDRRDPPPYRKLSASEAARYELGMAVFNTQFVVAGTPNAARRDGIGPLFNAASCDECHNNGARGRGPTEEGPLPAALVIQLSTPSPQDPSDPEGDPVYGRVFNTLAVEGLPPEGVATVSYEEAAGRYPDGAPWKVRVPRYSLTQLRYGPLSPHTIVKPRLAPALFGAGLLEAIDAEAIRNSGARDPLHGRFGWQASAASVRDQTARAFAREMGLTSAEITHDDCTTTETGCLHQPNGGSPEISAELFDAVVSFQRWLAVPASPTLHAPSDPAGRIFADLGCSHCHQIERQIDVTDSDGRPIAATIEPYTDLRLHDLGDGLADETVAGEKVVSRWRTAPLWGLGYRMSLERQPRFLHDGRARSAEEAILWHDGEAASARGRFERLSTAERKAMLHWLETL